MKNSIKALLIVIVAFGTYFILDDLFFKSLRKWIFELTNQLGISHILTYLISGIPLFIGVLIIGRKTDFFQNLGLDTSITKGFLFALICTIPMYIGFSIIFDFNSELSLNTFLISIISAGFFEELFFRGFLFGLLFKKAKLGFILSVLFGSIYFGLLHLYQSTEFAELLGIFLVTFLGSILFSWVYAEWNFNIWVPIFLHILMNLSWELFSVSDNAFGGIYSNIFRLITVALIIALTLFYKKKKGEKLVVTKKTLWLQKQT